MKIPTLIILLSISFAAHSATISFPHQITRWKQDIVDASVSSGVPLVVIASVMEVESHGDPNVESSAGAIGLMQVEPATALSFGITNYWEPRANILAGSLYLARLLRRYNGNLSLAIAAYNEGPTTIDNSGKIIEYSETREYVRKVFRVMRGN